MSPSYWRLATLGEEVEILDYKREPVNAKERAARVGTVPYYGAAGQVGWIDNALFNEELILLGEDGAPFFDRARDVAYRIQGPAWVNNHAHVLRAGRRMTNRFLLHQLNQVDYRPFVSGTTRAKLPQGPMKEIPLLVPPLDEQHRIVAAIDTHFSRLDAAVASLTRAKANVKRARASVLKAAVEGRLVPTEAALARAEGRAYEPASVLLERILVERRAAWTAGGARGKYAEPVKPETEGLPGLPEGWCWASVDQAAFEVRNGYSGKPVETGHVHILRISAVRPRSVDRSDHRYLSGCIEDYLAATAAPGDLLVTRYNGSRDYVGVMGLVRGDTPVVHPDKLIRVRLAAPSGTGAWFEVAFNTGASRHFIESRTRTTAGQAGVSGSDVKAVPVPLPPLAEQHRIVAEVDRRLSVLDALDATLEANLARCARLRQAVLKRAFEGRLVPAEAEAQA